MHITSNFETEAISFSQNNGPYSSFSISCLKARLWGIMTAFDNIIVNNSDITIALFIYRCSEENRTNKKFCCHGTVVTMPTTAYLLNFVS